ncbi:MAG: BrnT family toxin [Clostridiales bacterium]|jgi:uncharacterized DUF497 family protein|nr:BrnT family toxin [Clostridiales bacterium]
MLEIDGRFFDWDRNKNLINIRKHGVSFKMAASAFSDPDALILDDDKHSQDEDRFILIGINDYDKLLTVCHCFRNGNEVTRIISARKPNQYEEKLYETGGEF